MSDAIVDLDIRLVRLGRWHAYAALTGDDKLRAEVGSRMNRLAAERAKIVKELPHAY